MNFLVLGSGGRETSIIKKLYLEKKSNIFCIGTNFNPDIKKYTQKFLILDTDNDFCLKIKLFCNQNNIDIVIVGPEKYLHMGIVNYLNEFNINVIGPTKELAQIETNKYFTRELISKDFNISKYNPKYKYFYNLDNTKFIKDYLDICRCFNYDYVIKPIGLCNGKGVKLSKEHFENDLEGLIYSKDCIENSNQGVIIEELIKGEEFSLMTYTDGINFSHMPIVKDFKRLEENDKGPNTGSMGCISYSNHKMPFLTESNVIETQKINEQIINKLQQNIGHKYKGIIYGSFIKCFSTGDIKIIEYNCRYGDPECVNVIELLETNLSDIYKNICNYSLKDVKITYSQKNMISKYVVPINYTSENIILKDNNFIDINNDWLIRNENNIIFSSVNRDEKYLSLTTSRTFIFFETSEEDIHFLSENINKKLNDIIILSKYLLKFRKDIGLKNIINYKNSGVNINNGNKCVEAIKPHINNTKNKNTISKIGDFSGMISISNYIHSSKGFMNPILVSSIDGVGTKTSFLYDVLKLDSYDIVGQDIVNHCVNDILVKGAEPLFFMDYIASSKINVNVIEKIVKGMCKQCKIHNCPLLGGETAEMPKIYNRNELDIVGCMIGIVEKHEIIDGPKLISKGDIIIGLPSEGLHTNGFSLIRKLYEMNLISNKIISWLKQPHKSYFNEIKLVKENNIDIYGLCHITGGGLIENIPRVLPKHCKIFVNKNYLINNEFKIIQDLSNLTDYEMLKTFNCGIGMMIFISNDNLNDIKNVFNNNNVNYNILGLVDERISDENQVNFVNILPVLK